MKFYAGQPVICVNDDFCRVQRAYRRYGLTFPVRDRRYVVRAYVIRDAHPCIVLREIANVLVPYRDGTSREAGFWDERFEPATDISDLRRLLTVRDRQLEHQD